MARTREKLATALRVLATSARKGEADHYMRLADRMAAGVFNETINFVFGGIDIVEVKHGTVIECGGEKVPITNWSLVKAGSIYMTARHVANAARGVVAIHEQVAARHKAMIAAFEGK